VFAAENGYKVIYDGGSIQDVKTGSDLRLFIESDQMRFTKDRFVGLTWADGEHKVGFAIQCDKSDYRGVLAGIEGITGKKAVGSEALTVKN
jgi:hypothetical protein